MTILKQPLMESQFKKSKWDKHKFLDKSFKTIWSRFLINTLPKNIMLLIIIVTILQMTHANF